MTGQLAGKVAIVTGAGQGLGLAIARALSAEGARVAMTDRSDAVIGAAAALAEEGGDVIALRQDVCDRAQWDRVVSATVERFGALHCLVNNAGVTKAATIEDAQVEDFERLLQINLLGPFKGMQAAIPALRTSGGGSIINIASNATRKLLPLSSIYAASKAGLTALSQCSALQLGGGAAPIRVNTIHPGPHRTAMLLGENGETGLEVVDQLIATIPAGRIGDPSEIGSAAVYLASDASTYVNGLELFVDGGLAIT